jgi:hypothetical protein
MQSEPISTMAQDRAKAILKGPFDFGLIWGDQDYRYMLRMAASHTGRLTQDDRVRGVEPRHGSR